MKRIGILVCGVAGLLGAGCAPSGDISGWELVPQTTRPIRATPRS